VWVTDYCPHYFSSIPPVYLTRREGVILPFVMGRSPLKEIRRDNV